MADFYQIAQTDLVTNAWYVGRGRNANVGVWDGESFAVITDTLVYNGSFRTQQETIPGIKNEPYFTLKKGCFQPFKKLDNYYYSTFSQATQPILQPQLKIGRFYVGKGEISNVGRWEGTYFSVICDDLSGHDIFENDVKFEKHYLDVKGSFYPFIEVSEGAVVQYLYENEVQLCYAISISF